ncbi:hypothetical protein [Novosphingobium sp. JCM 18896]|uniref:hypothetical protein n=1 Tax=Novosphingobium sp. JCM 18896 TaxID=2989731 RepID=UPI0022239F04|nr:hypothetical protein [Novosphingobium sp. JCM 18896]MCW1427949.1 hypothetical protein [Novosphingobium sp. JCM 18896]
MKIVRHIPSALLIIAFAAQIALLLAGQSLLVRLIPVIFASVPLAYLALYNTRAQNSPRPTVKGFIIVAGLFWGLPALLSLLPEPSIKLEIVRLILIDGGILYAAVLLANILQPKKQLS